MTRDLFWMINRFTVGIFVEGEKKVSLRCEGKRGQIGGWIKLSVIAELPMLCGELLNGGFVSAGAVPAVPCGLLGLWLPGCLRATSPRLLTSPYIALLAELIAEGYLDHNPSANTLNDQNKQQLYDDYSYLKHFYENMDLARRNQHSNTTNCQSDDLDLDLDNDESVFLGE